MRRTFQMVGSTEVAPHVALDVVPVLQQDGGARYLRSSYPLPTAQQHREPCLQNLQAMKRYCLWQHWFSGLFRFLQPRAESKTPAGPESLFRCVSAFLTLVAIHPLSRQSPYPAGDVSPQTPGVPLCVFAAPARHAWQL